MGATSKMRYFDANFKRTKKGNAVYIKKFVKTRFQLDPYYPELVQNEVKWLQKLKDFDRTPTVISYKKYSIIMNFLGFPVTRHTIPHNWRDQIEYILTSLKNFGCSHNDIKRHDVLVREGKLYLIDFQHATRTRKEFEESHISKKYMLLDDRTAFIFLFNKLVARKKKYG